MTVAFIIIIIIIIVIVIIIVIIIFIIIVIIIVIIIIIIIIIFIKLYHCRQDIVIAIILAVVNTRVSYLVASGVATFLFDARSE